MAYDKQKAREYYLEYKKKGIKKGRSKKKKSDNSTSVKAKIKTYDNKDGKVFTGDKAKYTTTVKSTVKNFQVQKDVNKMERLKGVLNQIKDRANQLSEGQKSELRREIEERIEMLREKLKGMNRYV